MSPDKFTVKLQEAFNASQSLATRHGQQELKPAHLLLALLEQEGGITTPLLEKAAVQPESVAALKSQVSSVLAKLPKVSGGSGGLYLLESVPRPHDEG